jgi:hypothetical protein
MSAEPDEVHFSYLDSATPVTPAMAHRFLKEGFQCGYFDSYEYDWTEEEAKLIIERINMIQDDIYDQVLELYDIWLLFDRDVALAYYSPPGGGEVFKCNTPGFAIMMSMPLVKKRLFEQLYPNATYAGSAAEHTLDDMDEIIDHLRY